MKPLLFFKSPGLYTKASRWRKHYFKGTDI